MVKLVIGVLPEGLVRSLLSIRIYINRIQVIRIVHHLRCIWLLNIDGWWLVLLGIIREAADSTHAALEAYVVHLVHGLAGVGHDSEVAILVHGGDLSFEAVHEI